MYPYLYVDDDDICVILTSLLYKSNDDDSEVKFTRYLNPTSDIKVLFNDNEVKFVKCFNLSSATFRLLIFNVGILV